MAHIRQQIRTAVSQVLSGLNTTGANVFIARAEPLPIENTPGLVVSTPDDELLGLSGSPPRTARRALVVQVYGYVYMSGAVVDVLDDIAAEVETAMANNWSMFGLSKGLYLESTEITTSGEATKQNGELIMKFIAEYHHKENAPETAT